MEPGLCLCGIVHIGAVRALAVVAVGGGNRTLPTENDATDGVYERPPHTGQSSDQVTEIVRWREGADPAKLQLTY